MVSPHHVTLGVSIRRLRERTGMTLEGLSLASGIAVAELDAFEQGRLDLTYSLIGDLSDALGVAAPTFFGDNTPLWSVEEPEGLSLRFQHGAFQARYFLQGATQEQFDEVLEVLRQGLAVNGRRVPTRAVANMFLRAVQVWPNANPSDLWLFLVNRAYCDRMNHPVDGAPADLFQSWNRTSGYALEDVLVSHYEDFLRGHGLYLHSRNDEKAELLELLGNPDAILDKADVLVARAPGVDERLVGLINVKASLAERRTDDVPLSRQFMEAGFLSVFWTMDCKSFPAERPVNYGEYGPGDEEESTDKRRDLEDRGLFSACFSYNRNTMPTAREDAVSRIFACDFRNPDDAFSRFFIEH